MDTILLTEAIDPAGVAVLAARPEFRVVTALPNDPAFTAALPHTLGIGVRVARLDAALLAQAPRLRVAAKHGVGTDNIDVAYLAARGIPTMVTAEANSVSVAEHTLTVMLAAAKHLGAYDAAVRRGDWDIRKSARAVEVAGRRVLVVGYGRIGRRVAALCRAFGMDVVVHDTAAPAARAAAESGLECAPDLDAALSRADILTLHVPRTRRTAGMFDAARLARLPRGAVVVNCARGGLLDETALASALQTGALAAAALDVFDEEPMPPGHPLAGLGNVILTPHSAATTFEGARAMAVATARNLLDAIDGHPDPACVADPAAD